MRIKNVEHISELSESNAGDVVVFKILKDVRIKNLNRIVLAHLNINSLRNKFDLLIDQIKGNVDVLVISETKLDDSFPTGQFKILGYASPFRLDRDENGGGIMVFVREDIPVKFLSSENKPIEAFFFELNFHKKKWLVCCSYNPNKNNISSHLEALRRSLDIYSALFENTILVGDFNVEVNDPKLKTGKATQNTDIPVKILRENADIFSVYICDFFNETIRSGKFPLIL